MKALNALIFDIIAIISDNMTVFAIALTIGFIYAVAAVVEEVKANDAVS